MNVPKYIKQALQRRMTAAYSFSENDQIVSEWLSKHDVKVDMCDAYNELEALFDPAESAGRIIKAIKEKEK